jgi:hypothetical protein
VLFFLAAELLEAALQGAAQLLRLHLLRLQLGVQRLRHGVTLQSRLLLRLAQGLAQLRHFR